MKTAQTNGMEEVIKNNNSKALLSRTSVVLPLKKTPELRSQIDSAVAMQKNHTLNLAVNHW